MDITTTLADIVSTAGIDNMTITTLNFTRSSDKHMENIFKYLETMTTPLVSVVGTILNLLTVGAFLSQSLRKMSCCLYLAVRSLAVFGFLVSMFVAWTNTFSSLIQTNGICQITIFLSYFCPFVSVWMVVIISVENFIMIAHPARVGALCNTQVAKLVILLVTVIGLVVYNFPFWVIGVQDGQCTEKKHFMKVALILNNLDTVLTLLCPFVLMIILVPLVGLKTIQAYERKKRLHSNLASRKRLSNDSKMSPESRVTHLLLAVSLVFMMFHIPFHCIRIKLFFLQLTKQQPSRLDQTIHHIFRLIFNFDTVLSCAVYLIFGNNFRRVFCRLYFSRCICIRLPSTANTAVNRTPQPNLCEDLSQHKSITGAAHPLLPGSHSEDIGTTERLIGTCE